MQDNLEDATNLSAGIRTNYCYCLITLEKNATSMAQLCVLVRNVNGVSSAGGCGRLRQVTAVLEKEGWRSLMPDLTGFVTDSDGKTRRTRYSEHKRYRQGRRGKSHRTHYYLVKMVTAFIAENSLPKREAERLRD